MPYFPQEILDIIIGHGTTEGPSFSDCALLVSHTFHQIVLPYKFRSLTFENKNYIRPFFIIPKFCEAIISGDAHALSLAPLVQELHLIDWLFYGANVKHEELLVKIINSIVSFRNLTKLSMVGCVSSPTIMERLGKLVQLQSLRIWNYIDHASDGYMATYGALSNLQSLHTLECMGNFPYSQCHLACIPMKTLRILRSNDKEVIKALLTTDPPVQLKELCLYSREYINYASLVWNYLASVTSLTRLSLPHPEASDDTRSLIPPLQKLQYLHVHFTLAPRFANHPMKEMKIHTDRSAWGIPMVEVVLRWQGIVFPHVEYLETDRCGTTDSDINPVENWKEFFPNVKEVRCQLQPVTTYPCLLLYNLTIQP